MPAYRFCRTDDIALLTDAVNRCVTVHLEDQPALTSDDFKREIRELGVWCSSCMIATEDRNPIAVVTGAKRERETLVHRIGAHPDFRRRGHCRHLLESLRQKLTVLGPPRLVAEVPEDLPALRDLFECVGFQGDARFADFELQPPLEAPANAGEVGPVRLDELQRCGALAPGVLRSWERDLETLQNRKDQLHGMAVASHQRVEAWALFRDLPERGRREIVALGGAGQRNEGRSDSDVLLEVVVRVVCQTGPLVATIPRVGADEISWQELESMGFRQTRTYRRYAARVSAT